MHFEFSTASRIIFGPGKVKEVPPLAARMGKRALVMTGSDSRRASGLIEGLQNQGISTAVFRIISEPTTGMITEGVNTARDEGCDLVIGMGGGSVIDAGKAVAALITNPGDLFDYLEVIGKAQPIRVQPAPYVAIPTSAGTGTEVTKNAVIISKEHKVKVSMRSDMMLPRLVVVDPELTWSMPRHITAATGLDVLTQLIEAYVSLRANPITDGICREGLARAARSLMKAYENGRDASARQDMSIASLFSGLALANAGLGAVHGFAAPLGGRFDAPHGLICARLLPIVMEANIGALSGRNPGSPAIERYDEIARIITTNPDADAHRGVKWVEELCNSLHTQSLTSIGMSQKDIPDIVAKAMRASSMKGNPVELTEEELAAILERAL
jgi:alcohol dehydrogenase class IV